MSEESIAFLKSRPWRGNVRELQNVIEHSAVLVEPDQLIQPNEIPLYEESSNSPAGEVVPMVLAGGSEPYHVAKDRIVVQFEKEYLAALVARAAGNMSKAARLAGVDRTTLYRLIDKHQLMRGDGELSVRNKNRL